MHGSQKLMLTIMLTYRPLYTLPLTTFLMFNDSFHLFVLLNVMGESAYLNNQVTRV